MCYHGNKKRGIQHLVHIMPSYVMTALSDAIGDFDDILIVDHMYLTLLLYSVK